jgi:hypothetical protein
MFGASYMLVPVAVLSLPSVCVDLSSCLSALPLSVVLSVCPTSVCRPCCLLLVCLDACSVRLFVVAVVAASWIGFSPLDGTFRVWRGGSVELQKSGSASSWNDLAKCAPSVSFFGNPTRWRQGADRLSVANSLLQHLCFHEPNKLPPWDD